MTGRRGGARGGSLGRSQMSSKPAKPPKGRAFNLDDEDDSDEDVLASSQESRPNTTNVAARRVPANSNSSGSSSRRPGSSSPVVSFLAKYGVVLKFGNEPDELTIDSASAILRLEDAFAKESRINQDFEKFMREYFEDKKCLKSALMFFKGTGGDAAFSSSATGLVRLLLQVSSIQTFLFELLLDKAIKLGDESAKAKEGGINWVQCILSRFCDLPQLVNCDRVCDRLLDLIETQPVNVIKMIIGSLVGIIAEVQHDRVAERLMTLLRQKSELMAVILETLTNLNLDPGTSSSLKRQLVDSVASSPPSVVPELVFFILSDLSPAEAKVYVPKVREKLDLYQDNKQSSGEEAAVPKGESSDMSLLSFRLQVLLMEDSIVRAWKGAMEKASTWRPTDLVVLLLLQSMDNWKDKPIITLMKSRISTGVFGPRMIDAVLANAPEVAETNIKQYLELASALLELNDAACVGFGREMFQRGFTAMQPKYRQEIMNTLISLVGSSPAALAGGRPPSALESLAYLVRYNLDTVAEHAYRLSMFLELVNNRPLPQVRMLFDAFATIACYVTKEGRPFSGTTQKMRSEIFIIVRKQLGLPSPMLKKVGVVGAVMLLKALANEKCPGPAPRAQSIRSGDSAATSSTMESESSESMVARDPDFAEAKQLLQLALDSTEPYPVAMALLYDQLSTVLVCDGLAGSLTLEKYIWSRMYRLFSIGDGDLNMQTYVQELSRMDEYTACDWFTMKLLFQWDEEPDETQPEPIFLNLGPLLYKEAKESLKHGDRETASLLYALLPRMRVLAACEKNKKGKLDGIFTLLGIGVLLPDIIVGKRRGGFGGDRGWDWDWEELDPLAQKTALRTFFFTANWFIELISAFSVEIQHDDPEVLHIIVHRLRHLIYVRKFLARALKESMDIDFVPPPARFEIEHPRIFRPNFNTGKAGGGARRGRKRKADSAAVERTLARGSQDPTQGTPVDTQPPGDGGQQSSTVIEEEDPCQILSHYVIFFRELDVSAFKIFQAPLDLDLDFHDVLSVEKIPPLPTGDKPSIGLEEAEFLIMELATKLDFVFLSAPKKRFGGASTAEGDFPPSVIHSNLSLVKTKEVAKMVSSVVGFLAGYLQVLGSHFQAIIDAHDGVLDSAEMYDAKSRKISKLITLILRCFRALFSWQTFHQHHGSEVRETLQESLRALTSNLVGVKRNGSNAVDEDAEENFLGSQISIEMLVKTAFDSLRALSPCLVELDSAVELLLLLETLGKFAKRVPCSSPVLSGRQRTASKVASVGNQQLIEALVESAESYLKRSWGDSRGKVTPGDCAKISQIVKLYLNQVANLDDIWVRMKTLNDLIKDSYEIVLEELEASPEYKDDRFASLSKSTLPIYHQAALAAVLAAAKDITFALDDFSQDVPGDDSQGSPRTSRAAAAVVANGDWQRRPEESEPMNQLRLWRVALDLFEVLCRKTLEKHTAKSFFINAVKVGSAFITELSRSATPVMEGLFSTHRDDVLSLLTVIQKNHTRFFQHVCAQTKKDKDVGVGKFIPALKKSLETFLFRVKGMLAAHNCTAAFSIGALKHKNVRGEELESTLDPTSEADEEEEEEDTATPVDDEAVEDMEVDGGDEEDD